MHKLYHGSDNIKSQLQLMMAGMQLYEKVLMRKDVYGTGLSNASDTPFVIASPFSVEGTDWIVGDNLTERSLAVTYLPKRTLDNKNTEMTGRTLLSRAKDENKGAKKIVSLVKEAVKEKILEEQVKGEYTYASGKKEADLIHFLRVRMKNWDLYNGPSGKVNNQQPPTPDAAKVLIAAVESLDWDTSDIKKTTELIFNACTTGSVKVVFKSSDSSSKKDIYSYINAECEPSSTDVLYEIVNKNDLDSDEYDEDALSAASAFFSAESNSDGMKLQSYADDWYPSGWCLFWLQGPLSKAPKKYRINIIELVDGSTPDQGKEKGSGRKKHRENEKKLKDDERSSGAANGRGRGISYRDQKDLALIAQQQKRQDQTDFAAKMTKIGAVLRSLEKAREGAMQMATEWRQGGDLTEWRVYMKKVEMHDTKIEEKRSELEKLEQQSSGGASHVDKFLSIGTEPTSNKKQKTDDSDSD